MDIIETPNKEDWECVVCKTNETKPIVMIPGTYAQNNSTVEAIVVHIECLNPVFIKRSDDTLVLTQIIK